MRISFLAVATVFLSAKSVLAQESAPPASSWTFTGYLEAFAAWNFNDPDTRLTQFRGFDDRHQELSLANAVGDLEARFSDWTLRVAVQYGRTPDSYYLAQPADYKDLRLLQQVHATWTPLPLNRLSLQAGLFLSPIGPEGMAVKDNLNFSRSTLFFLLPFYHSGVRLQWRSTDTTTHTVALYRGWNRIHDNNDELAISYQWLVKPNPTLEFAALYFGGNERDRDASEGEPWRHLLDFWIRWQASDRWLWMAHLDAGRERAHRGDYRWIGVALYGQHRLAEKTVLTGRVDWFEERWPARSDAQPIFALDAPERGEGRLRSTTLTLENRRWQGIATYLELRRDDATGSLFFEDDARQPNASDQVTLSAGAVFFFTKGSH